MKENELKRKERLRDWFLYEPNESPKGWTKEGEKKWRRGRVGDVWGGTG